MSSRLDTQNIDHILLALADPTRRYILSRLSSGEARVTALAEPLDMSLNAVSKHIKILERVNLVNRRVEGREHFLTFNPRPFDETLKWMQQQRSFWTARLDMLEQILHEEVNKTALNSNEHKKSGGKYI
jgi:DNA-binding transcriptional ArsR family regulator